MQTQVYIDCPPELLLSVQMNIETFAQVIKTQAAIALFKEGRISSSLAARWLSIPRVIFLLKAMEAGAELLDDGADDFRRETSLL